SRPRWPRHPLRSPARHRAPRRAAAMLAGASGEQDRAGGRGSFRQADRHLSANRLRAAPTTGKPRHPHRPQDARGAKPRPILGGMGGMSATAYKRMVAALLKDLGSAPSELQRRLAESFAAVTLATDQLAAALVAGEDIDIGEYSRLLAQQLQLAEALGIGKPTRPPFTAIKTIVVSKDATGKVWETPLGEVGGEAVPDEAEPAADRRRIRQAARRPAPKSTRLLEPEPIDTLEEELPHRTKRGSAPRRRYDPDDNADKPEPEKPPKPSRV